MCEFIVVITQQLMHSQFRLLHDIKSYKLRTKNHSAQKIDKTVRIFEMSHTGGL